MKSLLVLAMASASAAFAQSNGSLRARELFYTPPPDAKPAQTAAPKPPVPAAPSAKDTAKKAAPAASSGANPTTPVSASASAPSASTRPASPEKPNASPATPAAQVSASAASPRQAVPTRLVSSAPLEAIPLGMRYAVLRRNDSGKFLEVDPASTFHSGDRIRLEVQANSTGYLYVVAQGSSGNWQVLFPSRDVAGGSNEVHRGEVRQIPAGNRGQFVFDEQPGSEKLFFVLTRQPEDSLDKLIYSVQGAPTPTAAPPAPSQSEPPRVMLASAAIGDDVISRIRGRMQSRDLIFETVDNDEPPSTASAESLKPTAAPDEVQFKKASYVVNPSTAADARVVADIKLNHK
jgi:uncharacterized protein DUF4384